MFPLTAALLASLVLVTSAENNNFECQAEGRFSHPTDRSSYVDCVFSSFGSLVSITDSCNGGEFSEDLKTCISDQERKNSFRRGRALISDHSYQYMCSEGNGFFCADCTTMVSCVDGEAYPHPCSDGSTCDSGSAPEMYQCQEEMTFDEMTTQCVNEENLPECERSGMFAIASNCSQYYTCIASKDGWIQKALSCETPNFMYNEASGNCEDPCGWNDGEFSCEAEGRFPDPRDCQRFFECIAIGDGYRVFSRECPAGYQWESEGQGVGICTKAVGDSSCKAFTQNKCVIPENMCSAAGGSTSTGADEPPVRRTARRGDRRT